MDYCVGCGWWIMILYLLEIGALFMVRGRPYSGETVVATLFSQANHHLQVWMAPMLSFDWNIVVPVALIVSVVEFIIFFFYYLINMLLSNGTQAY